MTMKRTTARAAFVCALAMSITAAGCAARGGAANPAAGTAAETATPAAATAQTGAPAPRVQDCAIVAISSPPKYACNGKVYTAFQLAQLRAEEEKKYQSGR